MALSVTRLAWQIEPRGHGRQKLAVLFSVSWPKKPPSIGPLFAISYLEPLFTDICAVTLSLAKYQG